MLPERNNENEYPQNPDRLKVIAGLLQDVSLLITELEANQSIEQTEHTFEFELIGDHEAVIPPSVLKYIPNIDQISVTIGREDQEEQPSPSPSFLTIDFTSPDKTITVSRSGYEDGVHDTDILMDTSFHEKFSYKNDGTAFIPATAKEQMQQESTEDFLARQQQIKKISREELNILIMSLVYPDSERGYQMFTQVDLLSPNTYDSLREFFQLSAWNNRSSMTHQFENSEAQFLYHKEEGQPVSFTIHYPEDRTGQIITAQSNLDTDFRLEFNTYENSEKKPYFPSTDEIQYLRSILYAEAASVNPVTVSFSDNEVTSDSDPETAFIKSGKKIFSRDHAKDILAQLSLDSTDSSAT